MSGVRAWTTLVMLTFRRLLWSTATLMLLFPLGACVLFLMRRRYGAIENPVEAFQSFSQFLLFVFASFIVPLCALAFATAGLGGDREDRTLVFLLVRPLPRWLILSAKFVAALPLVLGFACGSLWIDCRLAGEAGRLAFDAYLPAVVAMSFAYTALFQLPAALFRHSTIVALIYAVFTEVLLGNVPGIIKRVAINYYGRSMMYEAGVDHGLAVPDPEWLEPITGTTGLWTLVGAAIGSLIAAWGVFAIRDYEDHG